MSPRPDWQNALETRANDLSHARNDPYKSPKNPEYGPFGESIRATGPVAEVNPFRFSAKYFDTDTGLYYYDYRYYSPSMGPFFNRDPIEEQGGLNLYGFVRNDPVNRWDYGSSDFIVGKG